MNLKRNRKLFVSILTTFMMVLMLLPNMAFGETLVDYTGLQQGTSSVRIYMLNCGNLEEQYPNVFADKNDYTSRWNIKVNTDETSYFDNRILDLPSKDSEIEFVFSIGGSGANHIANDGTKVTDSSVLESIDSHVAILDNEGNAQARSIDVLSKPHSGSGGGTGGGPNRAVDVIVKVEPNTLKDMTTYKLALTSGLAITGRDSLNKDINFTFTTDGVKADSVKLSRTAIKLTPGGVTPLKATVTPNNVTNKSVTWTSSNKSVATVDNNGYVEGKKAGKAVIRATSGDGEVFAECAVTVAAKPPLSTPGTAKVSKYSKNYVKVKWKGISGEKGYQVWRATSKTGKYSRVAISKMTKSKYPYAKIKTKRGKTYYYKVRAYKKVGSKYVYSYFSAPKAYKLK